MKPYNQRDPRRIRRSGQVLILLLLFGGGSTVATCAFLTGRTASEIDKAVKRSVDDSGRRKAARDVVERWDETAKEFLEQSQERQEKLLKELQRHDVSRAKVEARFEKQDAELDAVTAKVLDLRFELRGHLTEAEWTAVFPAKQGD